MTGRGAADLFLVKIGRAYDLADRIRSINGKHDQHDYRYMRTAGWRFVCFREVMPGRLKISEKDSHRRFNSFKLNNRMREKLSEGLSTGYELFVGGNTLLAQILGEFRTRAFEHPELADVQGWCDPDFHRTYMPNANGVDERTRPAGGRVLRSA